MNLTLWQEIVAFDLDYPLSSYTFSLRLANENGWTFNFTRDAILEYKKFMYLAATAGAMVAPSEIVDVVWHQHLIYTQSYSAFCKVLGREVHHIPSTRSEAERQQLQTAVTDTRVAYEAAFGKQPLEIWECRTMQESLGLQESGTDTRRVLHNIIAITIIALFPVSWLLKPVYVEIDNPFFLVAYVLLVCLFALMLAFYNNRREERLIASVDRNSFLYKLSAGELIYLQSGIIEKTIHGYVNKLYVDGKIEIKDNLFYAAQNATADTIEEFTIIETLHALGGATYGKLVANIKIKPVFMHIPVTINSIKGYLLRSAFFIRTYVVNLVVCALLVTLGSVRIITGVSRHRPVSLIVVMVMLIILLARKWIRRFLGLVGEKAVLLHYEKSMYSEANKQDWDWKYFLLGSAVLYAPLVGFFETENRNATPDRFAWLKKDDGSSGADDGSYSSGGGDSGGGSSCSSCSSCGGCGSGGD